MYAEKPKNAAVFRRFLVFTYVLAWSTSQSIFDLSPCLGRLVSSLCNLVIEWVRSQHMLGPPLPSTHRSQYSAQTVVLIFSLGADRLSWARKDGYGIVRRRRRRRRSESRNFLNLGIYPATSFGGGL